MGKFFLGGVFLGAAVTWAVMHFLVGRGISPDEVEKKVVEARAQAEKRVEAERNAHWLDELNTETGNLRKELSAAKSGSTTEIAKLTSRGKELQARLDEVGVKLKRFTDTNKKLEDEIARLREKTGRQFAEAKRLLDERIKLVEPHLRLWRTLGEVTSVLAQAEDGWPNVALARKLAGELEKLAADYKKLASALRAFIEQNSKKLAEQLDTKHLTAYRVAIETEYLKGIDKLVAKVKAGVAGLKYGEATVSAERDGWTDTEVFVKAGDVIQVRADGIWSMQESWPPAGPEGWDGGSHFKISHRARAGGLILRIGVSTSIHPAYLGKPIAADSAGRIVMRMNDKEIKENAGNAKVRVVAASPSALRSVIGAWNKVVGRK